MTDGPAPSQTPAPRQGWATRNWPVVARYVGILFGTSQVLQQVIAGTPPDAGVLALAGGLLVAPNVFERKGDNK